MAHACSCILVQRHPRFPEASRSLQFKGSFASFTRRFSVFMALASSLSVCLPFRCSCRCSQRCVFKRWWQRFFQLRLGRTKISLWSNLHKFAGLWSLWFVLLMAFTGVWYLFEEARYKLGDEKFALVDAYPLAVHQLPGPGNKGLEKLAVGELIEIARQARPDLDITTIQPDRAGFFYVIGQSDDVLVRDRANKLFINPASGEIEFNQYAEDLNTYWRWSETVDILHFGTFAGIASKVVWFVFGLVLAGLSLSGGGFM